MLAELWITGYSSTNLVKDSTKSSQPTFFSPLSAGWRSAEAEPCTEGVLEGNLLLEPVVNETFRFSETKTSRFLYRDIGNTR